MSAVALLLSSCSTIRHTASTVDVDNKIVTFTVADLDVQPQKVQLSYNWNFNPFRTISISNVKGNVTAQLLQQCNADVLLDPQYVVEKRGFLRGGSVTVIGIPAKYENFHKMTPQEMEMMQKAIMVKKEAKKEKRWLLF